MAGVYRESAILSRYVLVPFDATQRNQENVVIKIALLDYSHSESRQWGSRALNASSSAPRREGGAESPVARIRNMDMKGREETVK